MSAFQSQFPRPATHKILCVGLTDRQANSLQEANPGSTLFRAGDAFEAIDLCLVTSFQMIVVNEQMEEMSGAELLLMLDDAAYHPHVPSYLVDQRDRIGMAGVLPVPTD